MSARVRLATAAGTAVALVGAVLVLDQGGGSAAAAAAPVATVTLPGINSLTSPVVGALSLGGSSGSYVYVTGPEGGPYRSERGRAGGFTPQVLGPLAGPDGAASGQTGVVAIPTGSPGGADLTGVRFIADPGGTSLGSVAVGAGELYLGQAADVVAGQARGLGALVAVPGPGGYQLVRRVPGAADAMLGDGVRADDWLAEQVDTNGALLRAQVGGAYTLRYLDYATGVLTTLDPLPADGQVQGIVFDRPGIAGGAGVVGFIEGSTLTTHSRADLSQRTVRELARPDVQWVSGSSYAWTQVDPATGRRHLRIAVPGEPATGFDIGVFTPGPAGVHRVYADVLTDGAGGFTTHVAGSGFLGLVVTGGQFQTQILGLPRIPVPTASLSISDGRVAYVDAATPGGQAHSQQVLAEDGVPRLAAATTIGPDGARQVIARGTRTVVLRSTGRLQAYGGTTALPTGVTATGTSRLSGLDGNWLVYGAGGADSHLVDLRSGVVSTLQSTDVDAGFRYTATTSTGPVQRVPLDGGPAVTVLPAGLCPIAALETRGGDVLIRCTSGEGRIYGPAGGAPVLTFAADQNTHLGSDGLLWRADGTGLVTATAYRTAGAAPVEVFRTVGTQPWAVDREGPWAAHVDATGHIVVSLVPGFPVPSPATRYQPVSPFRLLDTRTTGGAVVAGQDRTVAVAGVGGIPAEVTDVAVSVTVTQPTAAGFLAVYPDGRYGGSSTANFTAGQTVTTLAVVPVRGGKIALKVGSGSAQVVLDVLGYHATVATAGDSGMVPLPPTRLLDTRGGSPVSAGAPRTVPVGGLAGVPASARAVVVNVTVTGSSGTSWLAVSPTGAVTPTTVSYGAGRTTAALAVVPLSAGTLQLRVGGGTAHVLLDVAGYVPAADAVDGPLADYLTAGPTRLLDTRTSVPVTAGQDLRVPVAGHAGVPVGTSAVLVTATAIRPTASGFLTVYPTGTASTTSTLNYVTGQTVANAALVPLAADGSLSLRVGAGSSHVVLDVAGYLLR